MIIFLQSSASKAHWPIRPLFRLLVNLTQSHVRLVYNFEMHQQAWHFLLKLLLLISPTRQNHQTVFVSFAVHYFQIRDSYPFMRQVFTVTCIHQILLRKQMKLVTKFWIFCIRVVFAPQKLPLVLKMSCLLRKLVTLFARNCCTLFFRNSCLSHSGIWNLYC